MQYVATSNGWTRFISMQPQYSLLYREEEREMLPQCLDQGVGVIAWSPLARGKLTRDWEVATNRSHHDASALQVHAATEQHDRAVVEAVQQIARDRGIPHAQVALAGTLVNPAITASIVGATKPGHLADAIAAADVKLTEAEIATLEAPYVPHVVSGMVPPFGARPMKVSPIGPSGTQSHTERRDDKPVGSASHAVGRPVPLPQQSAQ